MAQLLHRGQEGTVVLPTGMGGHLAAWDATFVQEVHDITGFGDGGYRANLGGLKSCAGNASGFLTSGTANDNPNFTAQSYTGASMVLTAFTGGTYTFNAIVSNIRIGVRVDLPETIAFDFVSTGTITEAWVVS